MRLVSASASWPSHACALPSSPTRTATAGWGSARNRCSRATTRAVSTAGASGSRPRRARSRRTTACSTSPSSDPDVVAGSAHMSSQCVAASMSWCSIRSRASTNQVFGRDRIASPWRRPKAAMPAARSWSTMATPCVVSRSAAAPGWAVASSRAKASSGRPATMSTLTARRMVPWACWTSTPPLVSRLRTISARSGWIRNQALSVCLSSVLGSGRQPSGSRETRRPVVSSPARTSPASAWPERCLADSALTRSSPAMHSSTCRSRGCRAANTSLARRPAMEASPSAKARAAATGSAAVATARAVSTIAADQPWPCRMTASATSAESLRACSAISVRASSSSRRSTSPRITARWPRSSGTRRPKGRSKRESSNRRSDSGSEPRRWSIIRIDALARRCASSMTTRVRGRPSRPLGTASRSSASRSVVHELSPLIQRTSCSPVEERAQPPTPRVLPAPTGATRRRTQTSALSSSSCHRRDLGT